MMRREFIAGIGGAAAMPFASHAQPAMRRVALMMATRETDPEGQAWFKAFLQGFQQRGWIDGRTVTLTVRWSDGNLERTRAIAEEFVALKPDLIVVNSTTGIAEMKRATSSIPTIFVLVNEPVVQGFIASMPRPGGNITGFTMVDFSLIGKSVETLKTMAPAVMRAGLMFNPKTYPYYETYVRQLQEEPSRPVEVSRTAVSSVAEIEAAIAEIAARPGGGLVVPPDPFTVSNRAAIRAAVMRSRLPHIFTFQQFVSEGGLMSYGPDTADIFRRSADYADRILKGENPAELPAQQPTKFELAINLKTAKVLGLDVPPTLLAIADEVIE